MELNKLDILKISNNICMAYMLVWVIQTYYLPATGNLMLANSAIIVFVILNDTLFVRSGKLGLYTLGRALSLCVLVLISQLFDGSEPRIAVGILCILLSYYGYMHGSELILPKIQVISYYVALYVIGFFTGNRQIYPVALVLVIITAVLSVLLYNELNIQRHFMILKGQNMVPYEEIKRTNRFMLVIATVITGVMSAMAILSDYGDKIYAALKRGLIAFLTWLFSFLPKGADEAIYEDTQQQGGVDYSDILNSIPQKENKFLEAFWNAMTVVLYCLSALVVVVLLYKIAVAFYNRFNEYSKKEARDKIESLKPKETKSRVKAQDKENAVKIPFFATSADMKIRRMYYKFIKTQPYAKDIDSCYTPEEIEMVATGQNKSVTYSSDSAKEMYKENDMLWQIHLLYEKARYNPKACQNGDVLQMKNLIKQQ